MRVAIWALGGALAFGLLAVVNHGAGVSELARVAWPTVRVEIVGEPEVVMRYRTDSCPAAGGMDLPDMPARAVRRPGDEWILLFAGNAPDYYVLVGPDFARLRRDCTRPVLRSGDSPAPHTFDHQEWILSVYREGRILHALVHNEYHDPTAPNCKPGATDPSNPCWYNAITYAASRDGGRTFLQPQAPGHVVAAPPIPWNPLSPQPCRRGPCPPPPYGYFGASNIVRGADGYYYAMFMAIPDPAQPAFRGTCLMRTATLADPASWRAWDGEGFTLPMPSPYDEEGNPRPTGLPPCTFVAPETIGTLHESLTYNAYLGMYILVGSAVFSVDGVLTCGVFFSLSPDLLRWSPPRLIMPTKLPYSPCNPDGTPDGSLIYPSLIDHDSPSPSFEVTGQEPYLYFVRWNSGLDRDLLRVRLRFTVEPEL